MKNLIQHKGYYGTVEYSPEDELLYGQVLGISDLISYEGQSVQELKEDFINGLEDYLEACKVSGRAPDKPFSGEFILTIDPGLHARLAACAQTSGQSLNQYAGQILAKCVADL
ncbi:MAG: type II toxin-antitoxin system HicB family antitoxin [Desulfovibrio sp.]|nr:type II toxin-antitoxin system HicB family antitoxin [Desulfovibrio sp.]